LTNLARREETQQETHTALARERLKREREKRPEKRKEGRKPKKPPPEIN
jgi:hypothetical protein